MSPDATRPRTRDVSVRTPCLAWMHRASRTSSARLSENSRLRSVRECPLSRGQTCARPSDWICSRTCPAQGRQPFRSQIASDRSSASRASSIRPARSSTVARSSCVYACHQTVSVLVTAVATAVLGGRLLGARLQPCVHLLEASFGLRERALEKPDEEAAEALRLDETASRRRAARSEGCAHRRRRRAGGGGRASAARDSPRRSERWA